MTYATDRMFEEIAYVSYHFHWSLDEILDLGVDALMTDFPSVAVQVLQRRGLR